MTSGVDNVDEVFDMYSVLPFHVLGFIRVVVAVFGVITNAMSIRVLIHKSLWSATSILLISLVVYDTFFLAATAVSVITGLIPATTIDDNSYLVLASIIFPIRFVMQVGSHYSTVALTVERFIVVVKPFKAKAIWTIRNARKVILLVFVFTVLFNIPRFVVFSSISSVNVTEDEPVVSDDNVRFWYSRFYEVYLTLIIFYIVPYTVIMTLNIRLIIQLRRSSKETRNISTKHNPNLTTAPSPSQHEDGLTVIMLGLTSCFFVCCVIPMTLQITMIMSPDMFSSPSKIYLQPIGDTMLCLNSATNFLFYCLFGRRFRNVFCKLFCRQRSKVKTLLGSDRATRKNSSAVSIELMNGHRDI